MINSILYYILTLIIGALFASILKILASFNKKFKNIELSNQNILRSEIVRIYYQYKSQKAISFYEKEVANMCGDAYKQNSGNSFVADLLEEINTWEVI